MPIRFFKCTDGEQIKVDDCMNECRLKDKLECGRCLSRRTLNAISQDRPIEFGFSTTQLLRGTRESYLKYKHDYAIDPQDGVFALHGTRVHDKLERYTPPDTISELRLSDDVCSGAFDNYDNGVLYDTKTYGSYQVAKTLGLIPFLIPDGVYKRKSGDNKVGDPKFKKIFIEGGRKNRLDLAIQLNDYRMKLEASGEKVDETICEVIVRDGGTFIATSRGVTQRAYLIKINKISDRWISRYMRSKANLLKSCLESETVPPVCTPRERWHNSQDGKSMKCLRFCPVWEHCDMGVLQHDVFGNELD